MAKALKDILYVHKNDIYLLKNNEYEKFDEVQIDNLKNYDVLLDDDYFVFESIDINVSSKKKTKRIIENYLITTYPKDLVATHYYCRMHNFVMIAIPKKTLHNFMQENADFLKNAKNISTPLLETIYSNSGKYIYKTDGVLYEVTDNGIAIIPGKSYEEDEVLHKENLIGNINNLSSKLNIFENTGNIYYLKQLAPVLIVLIISYGLFVTGESFQYMKYSSILNSVRSDLQAIYSNAGVADAADPYGMLLYKAKGSPNEAKTLISNLLEKLSQSIPASTTVVSMNYKTGELKINGEAKDLKTLEDIESSLSNNLDKSAQIINTNKDGEIIKFSIRVSL
ncbi:hypothetical protein [Flexistipes sp.]|uniref:hypothetical protein n=1 Tax=Flexistipes sp. TaxID=3088135 RepID=UPI002E242CE6|nr:hypothetical protein [Flexistipes sp.]